MDALGTYVRDTPAPSGVEPLHVLLCSVASDSHMWNLVALQLELEGQGHRVLNLGACTPVEAVLDACHTQKPDCLVVSSVNGHGHVDGAVLIVALRADRELVDLPVVIGGKLGLHGTAEDGASLNRLGYDAVFPVENGGASKAVSALNKFLETRIQERRR